jgi:hypothetical protein
MGLLKNMTMAVLVLFIAGCTSPPPPEKTVFDPLLKDEERARAVQKTVDEHADATRKSVDDQERGDTAP